MSPHVYQVLFQISPGYPWDKGRLPTCYSPVCHASKLAFDLHALDMPPAFTLSQDQTLSKNRSYTSIILSLSLNDSIT